MPVMAKYSEVRQEYGQVWLNMAQYSQLWPNMTNYDQ